MTTQVKILFSDDLSEPNSIFNAKGLKASALKFGGVSFETKLQTWDEPIRDAIGRVSKCFDEYRVSQSKVFRDRQLYLFAATNSTPTIGPVARHKRLWRAFDPPFCSVAIAIRRSQELEIHSSHGTCFAGVLGLPTEGNLIDLQRQMMGYTAFYMFSKDDLTHSEAVSRLFEAAVMRGGLDWSRMIAEICSDGNLVVRGSGGFYGDREVALDIIGASKFPRTAPDS